MDDQLMPLALPKAIGGFNFGKFSALCGAAAAGLLFWQLHTGAAFPQLHAQDPALKRFSIEAEFKKAPGSSKISAQGGIIPSGSTSTVELKADANGVLALELAPTSAKLNGKRTIYFVTPENRDAIFFDGKRVLIAGHEPGASYAISVSNYGIKDNSISSETLDDCYSGCVAVLSAARPLSYAQAPAAANAALAAIDSPAILGSPLLLIGGAFLWSFGGGARLVRSARAALGVGQGGSALQARRPTLR